MEKKKYIFRSLLNASGAFAYIALIALFFYNAQSIFGKTGDNPFLTPIFMLLLFVISASVVGFLVLGKPVQLYLDGRKKEAFALFFSTLGWLALFLFAVAAALASR